MKDCVIADHIKSFFILMYLPYNVISLDGPNVKYIKVPLFEVLCTLFLVKFLKEGERGWGSFEELRKDGV